MCTHVQLQTVTVHYLCTVCATYSTSFCFCSISCTLSSCTAGNHLPCMLYAEMVKLICKLHDAIHQYESKKSKKLTATKQY